MSRSAGNHRPEPTRTGGIWAGWRAPALAGLGFCALQVALALLRFGRLPEGGPLGSVLFGLALFFAAGALAYLLVRALLRGASRRWRRTMLVAAVVATPLAVAGSLMGGLFGPAGVLVWALLPYLLLVGLPVWGRKVLLVASRRNRPGLVNEQE